MLWHPRNGAFDRIIAAKNIEIERLRAEIECLRAENKQLLTAFYKEDERWMRTFVTPDKPLRS